MSKPNYLKRLDAIFAEMSPDAAPISPPESLADARLAAQHEAEPLPRCERTGKVSYPSQRECNASMNRIKNRRHTCRHLRAYRCEFCDLWHMTSRPKHQQF